MAKNIILTESQMRMITRKMLKESMGNDDFDYGYYAEIFKNIAELLDTMPQTIELMSQKFVEELNEIGIEAQPRNMETNYSDITLYYFVNGEINEEIEYNITNLEYELLDGVAKRYFQNVSIYINNNNIELQLTPHKYFARDFLEEMFEK